MVDNFAIAISHLLVAIAAWRLIWRADLDAETPPPKDEQGTGFFTKQATRPQQQGKADA